MNPVRDSGAHSLSLTVALALAAAALLLGGCASVDPTDPTHFIDVQVVNDTQTSVQLIQCDTSCNSLHYRQKMPAGASTIVNVSNEGIEVGYLVESPSGKALGCIYMTYEHVKRQPAVAISSMTRCE